MRGQMARDPREAGPSGGLDQGDSAPWTLSLDMSVLKSESPTTTSWFDVAHVLAAEGADWQHFRSRIAGEAGISLADAAGQ